MGKDVKDKIVAARLRKEQRKLLEGESQHSDFYWVIDPVTGAGKRMRRSSKKKSSKKKK